MQEKNNNKIPGRRDYGSRFGKTAQNGEKRRMSYSKKNGGINAEKKNANYGEKSRMPDFKAKNAMPGDSKADFLKDNEKNGTVGNGAVIGRNAVRELLRSGRPIDKLLVQAGEREGALIPIVGEAIARKIPVVETERRKMDVLSGFVPHQGVIALAAEKEYCTVEDILNIAKERGEKPLIVIADGISDPYNLGAVIRCAEGCGAHGLIIPKRHAAGLSPVVTKASAGAIEYLAIAKVTNIAATIQDLKDAGVWIFAAEAGGSDFRKTDLSVPAAIVLGSEGEGVSELIRKKCDYVISIPMYGRVNSYNVSAAAAIVLSEVARQQREQ